MKRVIFLDNLRYLMVLLVVVLHAAISYGNFVPWWCVKDTGSVLIDILLLALSYWSHGLVLVKFGIVALVSITLSYGVSHYMIRPYPKRSIAGIYTVFILVLMITGHAG